MKRNVEYFVYKTDNLKKSETLEERLSQIKEENQYHFVITHKAQLIRLNDAELNNKGDSDKGMECVHLFVLAPPPGLLNLLIYFFYLYRVTKKVAALKREFNDAQGIPVLHYLYKCKMILDLKLEKLKLKSREIEVQLKEIQLQEIEQGLLLRRMSNN